MVERSAISAPGPSWSSHKESTRRSTETMMRRSIKRRATSALALTPPMSTGRPSHAISTGPSTRISRRGTAPGSGSPVTSLAEPLPDMPDLSRSPLWPPMLGIPRHLRLPERSAREGARPPGAARRTKSDCTRSVSFGLRGSAFAVSVIRSTAAAALRMSWSPTTAVPAAARITRSR